MNTNLPYNCLVLVKPGTPVPEGWRYWGTREIDGITVDMWAQDA